MENKLTDDSILKEYSQADEAGKQLLERLYGKAVFQQNDYKTLKTLEDCCRRNNYDPSDIKVTVPAQLSKFNDSIQAYVECLIEAEAIRNGKEVDYSNDSMKWEPLFIYKPGVGFSFDHSYHVYSDATLGSRLSFPEKEQSDYFATQFLTTHKRRLT